MALATEIDLTWLKIGLCELGLNYMDMYIDLHCIEFEVRAQSNRSIKTLGM